MGANGMGERCAGGPRSQEGDPRTVDRAMNERTRPRRDRTRNERGGERRRIGYTANKMCTRRSYRGE